MNGDQPHRSDIDVTEDDRRLRALLESSAYEGRPDPRFRRQLQRDIRHAFRYHRVRSRVATAAVVAVAALVTAFQFTDVGSDGFGLVDTGFDTRSGARIYENAFRPGKSGGVDEHGDPLGRDVMEATEEALAAGAGRLLRVEGWSLGGGSSLSAVYAVTVDGQERIRGEPLPVDREMPRDVMVRFYDTHLREFLAAVDSGLVPVTGTGLVDVDGHRVLLTKWSRKFEDFGVVTFMRGQPLEN